jgi:flotillin
MPQLNLTILVPAFILAVILAILFVIWALTKRYKRVSPNRIGVVFGKKRGTIKTPDGRETEIGFKLITGGGVFIWPIVEQYAEMSIEAFQIPIAEDNVPTKKNVSVHVAGIATCRVSPVYEEQVNAVTNFLGKTESEIASMIGEILRGHLRSIIGGLEVEELLRERAKFNESVIQECSQELARMGIRIFTLVIQDVKDKEGYIDALGKQAVAVAKRDAQIATAEAERETTIKTSDATRAAAEARAANEAKIKEAEKERDIQLAHFRMETAAKQAEAEMAGEIAKTEQEKRLGVLQAERDGASIRARTEVQQLEALRKAKELEATTIVTAEATAKAASIRAEGEKNAHSIDAEARRRIAETEAQTARITAEGQRNAAILAGEGEAKKSLTIAEAQAEGTRKTMEAQAAGQKALAASTQAQLLATAEGEKARLLAVAEGEKAKLLAVAEGEKAKLLAQAQGNKELAEALRQLSADGKLMFILDRLPGILDRGGEAGAKIAQAVFEPVASGVARIGPVQITDLGGGDSAKDSIANMGAVVPKVVFDFFTQMSARGIDVTSLLKKALLNPEQLVTMIQPTSTSNATAQTNGDKRPDLNPTPTSSTITLDPTDKPR